MLFYFIFNLYQQKHTRGKAPLPIGRSSPLAISIYRLFTERSKCFYVHFLACSRNNNDIIKLIDKFQLDTETRVPCRKTLHIHDDYIIQEVVQIMLQCFNGWMWSGFSYNSLPEAEFFVKVASKSLSLSFLRKVYVE